MQHAVAVLPNGLFECYFTIEDFTLNAEVATRQVICDESFKPGEATFTRTLVDFDELKVFKVAPDLLVD